MVFEMDLNERNLSRKNAVIKIIGVGGAGNNAINRMMNAGVDKVIFICANTDLQDLDNSEAEIKLQLGAQLTKGLGTGGDPIIGERAAKESESIIRDVLEGTDMVFITAGMGGGTGTGASPFIAQLASEMNILTVAVITTPFSFEMRNRAEVAREGLKKLSEHVDTLIKVSNNRLLKEISGDWTVTDAFLKADEVLYQGVEGISALITQHGLINLDFADIEAVMRKAGTAVLGIGHGKGEERAKEAAKNAIESKLLDKPVETAKAIIMNITAPKNIKMQEMNDATQMIKDMASEEADVKFGLCLDDNLPEDEMKITLIATGFDNTANIQEEEQPAIYRLPEEIDDLDL